MNLIVDTAGAGTRRTAQVGQLQTTCVWTPTLKIIYLPSSVIHETVVEEMNQLRRPSLGMTAVRVILITVIATLLCFAVALFLGIVGFGLANLAKGGGLNMILAFRNVALPVGLVALVVAFPVALVSELRRYRRARADSAHYKSAA